MNGHYIKKELAVGDFRHKNYFTEFELNKENLLFCDPVFYIDSYYNDALDKKSIYNQQLLIFNKILKFFFRAPLKLVDWQKNSIKSLVTKYLLFRNILVNDRYEKDIETLFRNNSVIVDPKILSNIDKERYLTLIIKLYQELDFLRSKVQAKRIQHQLNIKDFNGTEPPFNGKEYSTVRFMHDQIKTRLDKQIDFFLIHGSYATVDFISNWSDLDTFVILNKDIFNDVAELAYTQKELQKLSMLCYKINPLAHHALFIFPDLILKHYLNIFLPIPVLNHALALKKKNDLTLWQTDSRPEEFQSFWSYLIYFRNKVLENNYSQNLADWENDVVHLLMLPTLVLQLKEGPLYKKFSFEKIKESFPNFNFNLVDWSEEKRKGWKLFNLLRFYPNLFFNLLSNHFNTNLINKYRFFLMKFKKPADSSEVIEDFTKKALNLYEIFFYHCLKKYKNNA